MTRVNRGLPASLMLAAVVAVAVGSCSSPADVPANRRETREGEGNETFDSSIRVYPGTIDLGIYPDVSIANTGVVSFVDVVAGRKMVGSVISAGLASGTRGFDITGPTSFTMASKGNDSAFFRIPLRFSAADRGRYLDTLIVADTLRIPLKAIVGTYQIYVTDAVFDSIAIGERTEADVHVVNNSDSVASIQTLRVKPLQGGGFSVLNLSYYDIQPGEKYTLNMEFEPASAGTHVAEVEVGIRDPGTFKVDSVGMIIGRTR